MKQKEKARKAHRGSDTERRVREGHRTWDVASTPSSSDTFAPPDTRAFHQKSKKTRSNVTCQRYSRYRRHTERDRDTDRQTAYQYIRTHVHARRSASLSTTTRDAAGAAEGVQAKK